MRITKEAYEILNNYITGEPPETGGILGSSDDNVITHVVLDKQNALSVRCCSYSPNVDYLNGCIINWMRKGIKFMGVFHTHFAGVATLSEADKIYINSIMTAMPREITFLMFPVFVLPERKLICYRAEREKNLVNIIKENLEII